MIYLINLIYMIFMIYIYDIYDVSLNDIQRLSMSRFKIVMDHFSPGPMLGAPLEAMVSSRWWRKKGSQI